MDTLLLTIIKRHWDDERGNQGRIEPGGGGGERVFNYEVSSLGIPANTLLEKDGLQLTAASLRDKSCLIGACRIPAS